MAIQQLSASAFGGLKPTSRTSTPVTGTAAPWQRTSNYDPRFSGVSIQQPQGGGGQSPNQVGGLLQWMQSLYPEAPTTPQPLAGGYGSEAWNILDPFSGGAGMGGAGGGVPASPQISTGITQPNMPAKPTMPGMGAGPEGIGGMANQGMAANWDQAIQPAFMKLLASYYPSAAGLQGGFEQAQSQAGLGWGGLQNARQGSLMQALAGLV